MKIRSGFVSNSSSSSFIIGIPEKIKDEHMFLLELFNDLLVEYKEDNRSCEIGDPKDIIKDYEEKIMEWEKDIELIDSLVFEINEFLTEENVKIIDRYLELNAQVRHGYNARHLRHLRDDGCNLGESSEIHTMRIVSQKRDIQKHISEYKEEVSQLKEIKYSKIVKLEMDISWRCRLEEQLLRLAEAGIVKIIKEETT